MDRDRASDATQASEIYRNTYAQPLGDAVVQYVAEHPVVAQGAVLGPHVLGATGAALELQLASWLGVETLDRLVAKARGIDARDRATTWDPRVGVEVGKAVVAALTASLDRVGRAPDLLATNAFDRMVQREIAGRAVATSYAENVRARDADPASLVREGDAKQYFATHRPAFTAAVSARLATSHPPTGHAQLAWATASFVDAFAAAFVATPVERAFELTDPVDGRDLIEQHRTKQSMGWVPALGSAYAMAIEAAVRASLPRMTARYVTVRPHAASELLASHPIDRLVATALCTRDVVMVTTGGAGGTPALALRDVALSYPGEADRAMWSWVRVDGPADASAEEVAKALWGDPALANRLVAAAPLFQVRPPWSQMIPQLARFSPVTDQGHDLRAAFRPARTDGLDGRGVAALAGTAHETEIALAQQHGVSDKPQRDAALDVLEGSMRIALDLQKNLGALAKETPHAIQIVAEKSVWMANASDADVAKWQGVFDGQHAILAAADAGVAAVVAALPGDRSEAVVELLATYDRAAGASLMGDSARALLAEAEQQRKLLDVTGIANQVASTRRELASVARPDDARVADVAHAAELEREHDGLASQVAAAHGRALADADDQEALDKLQFDAERFSQRTSIATLLTQVATLRAEVAKGSEGRNTSVELAMPRMLAMLDGSTQVLDQAFAAYGALDAIDARHAAMVKEVRRTLAPMLHVERAAGLADAKAKLDRATAATAEVVKLGERFALLGHFEKELVDQIAMTIVTMGASTLLRATAGAVRGAVAVARTANIAAGSIEAGEVVEGGRAFDLGVKAATFVGDAAMQAGFSTVANHGSRDDAKRGFVDNLISSAAVMVALKPLEAVAHDLELLEKSVAELAKESGKGKAALKVAYYPTSMLLSMGVNHAVQRGLAAARGQEVPEQTLVDWALEGAGMGLGHAISASSEQAMHRAEMRGVAKSAELVVRWRDHLARAKRVEATGNRDETFALLVEHQRLLGDEVRMWRQAAKASGSQAEMLRAQAIADGVARHRDRLVELAVRQAGLEPEVEGTKLWAGSRGAIERAILNAKQIDPDVRAHFDAAERAWVIDFGAGQFFEIREHATPSPRANVVGADAVRHVTVESVQKQVEVSVGGLVFVSETLARLEVPGETVDVHIRRGGDAVKLERRPGEITVVLPQALDAAHLEVALVGKLTELRVSKQRQQIYVAHAGAREGGLGPNGVAELTSREHGEIAELRTLRDLAMTATGAEADALGQEIAAKERALGLVGNDEAARTRRAKVDVQIENQTRMKQRYERDTDLNGAHGHPGIELHSHFAGIVLAEVFRQRANAFKNRGVDDGSWLPLLKEIVDRAEAHQYKEGTTEIIDRKQMGDAKAYAKGIQKDLEDLDAYINTVEDPTYRRELRRAEQLIAQEAATNALSASKWTEYDGAYEVRQKIIEATFGQSTPGKQAPRQDAWDDYIREAILQLARDGVAYSEQSAGTKKINEVLHPERIKAAIDKLVEEGLIKKGQVDVRMLGMTLTNYFGEQEDLTGAHRPIHKNPQEADAKYDANVVAIGDKLKMRGSRYGGGFAGGDIGGPEVFTFDPKGGERFIDFYRRIARYARENNRLVVVRSHVGEALVDVTHGSHFNADENRVVRNPGTPEAELSHIERGRRNVEQWLLAMEQVSREEGIDPRVNVRFGHVTMATPDQMERMQRLGIIAEINLGSNVTSGVMSQTKGIDGPRNMYEQFEGHSFLSGIFQGTEIVMGTDGGAVMHTSMREELVRARTLIEQVLAGDATVSVSAARAGNRGKPVPNRPDERALSIHEMTSEERQRFQNAYQKIYDDAANYYMRRPVPSYEPDATLHRGAHFDDLVREAGLVEEENAWRGPREAVDHAIGEARDRGFGVVMTTQPYGAIISPFHRATSR